MLRRLVGGLALLALAAGLLSPGGGFWGGSSSAHASTPGSDPASALPVPAGPASVAPGQRIWYGFQYAGDRSQILTRISAAPGGSARFSVWTSDDIREWSAGQGENPVGRGTPQIRTRRNSDGSVDELSLYNGDLIWEGSFPVPGRYYVAVDQSGPDQATINLSVAGTGVSAIAGPTAQAVPVAAVPARTSSALSAVQCAPVPVTLVPGGSGSGPGQAAPLPTTSTYLLPVGRSAWYAFQYAGDRSQILIDLRATPDNSAKFAVHTPEDIVTPVGRGTQQTLTRTHADGSIDQKTLYGGDLIWSGSFRSPGTYYVEVSQTGSSPSTLALGINGSGVAGGQPASALPSSAQPNAACSPQPTPAPVPAPLAPGGPGSSTGQALALPSDGARLLGVGQSAWYTFQYAGDGSQILIDLKAVPDNSAGFAVYTPEDIVTPVGRGTQQTLTRTHADGSIDQKTLYGGDLIWSGSFRSPGTYYVEVKQTGPAPSAITLGISGSGVGAPQVR